jgi:hypothetical protein
MCIRDSITIGNRQVFITERRRAKVAGSQGQFASVLPLTGTFGYIQGGSNNQTVNINYWEDEIELSVGEDLEPHELVVES